MEDVSVVHTYPMFLGLELTPAVVEMVLAHTFRHKVLDHCLIVGEKCGTAGGGRETRMRVAMFYRQKGGQTPCRCLHPKLGRWL